MRRGQGWRVALMEDEGGHWKQAEVRARVSVKVRVGLGC